MNKALFLLFVLLSLFSVSLIAQQDFFDSDFDGIWSGMLWTNNEFAFGNFPMVFVLNTDKSTGTGVAVILEDPATSLTSYSFLKLKDIYIKKQRIQLTLELVDSKSPATREVNLKLKYNRKTNILKGKFISSKEAIGNGTVSFYKSEPDSSFSGIWSGSKPGNFNSMILLYDSNGIKGRGLAGESFGNVLDVVINNNSISGRVVDNNFPYSFKLDLKGKLKILSGTFEDTVNSTHLVNLFPLGTNGKKPKIRKFTPSIVKLAVSTPTVQSFSFSLKGKNFTPATILFTNIEKVTLKITKAEKRLIVGTVEVDDSVSNGTKVDILALNPDNQSNIKLKAITIESTTSESPLSFANDIQPIFNSYCISCHGSSGGLSLSSPSYSRIVNVSSSAGFDYINPSNAMDSYIIMKLEGDSRISGSRMPFGGMLSRQNIDKIIEWLREGAKNN